MLAGLASLLPLGLMLLRTSFFQSLQHPISDKYASTGKSYLKPVLINTILMWLYFPLIFGLWGIHLFLVKIDVLFPQMLTNGIVWWFLWINIIGFIFFRRWFKKEICAKEITLYDLGLSEEADRFAIGGVQIGKTLMLAAILFLFAYLVEHTLESIFIVDFRFIFPFASDLTAFRIRLWFTYFPFLLVGFLLMSVFLHGQLRRPQKPTWLKTFASWSVCNILVFTGPPLVIILVQYLPFFFTGTIPFEGPAGFFIALTQNLFHLIIVLMMVIPIQTWFYQLTGRIYLGATLNAALVTWMFVSSQVIAPVPV
jgi:hypothetical protein